MRFTRLSKRYAKAFFEISIEQGCLEKSYSDFNQMITLCNNKDFFQFITSPIIHNTKKINVLNAILQNSFNKLTIDFVAIILSKNRDVNIPEIALEFNELYNNHNAIELVDVVTAVPINQDLKDKFTILVNKFTENKIKFNEIIDENIIGGFILKFDNKQIDESIVTRINKLQKEFNVNMYVKGL